MGIAAWSGTCIVLGGAGAF